MTLRRPRNSQKRRKLLFCFRDLHSDQRLALPADVGALGDMAQAIEVHVRAAVDRDERAVPALLARDVALDASDGKRASGLGDRAIVFEDVLDSRRTISSLLTTDFIHELLCQPEGLFADAPHRNTVGKNADAIERDALARLERAIHGIGVVGLDADDADLRETDT